MYPLPAESITAVNASDVDNDCHSEIVALPVCADSSWTMYLGQFNYFCCETGQVGVFVPDGYGVCADSGVAVPASELASTVSKLDCPQLHPSV